MDLIHPESHQLIKALDEAFPPRCIRRDETPQDAHRYAGKRELVEYLLEKLRQTEEDATAEELLSE